MKKIRIVARTPIQKSNRAAVRNGRGPLAKRYMARFKRPTKPEGDSPSL